MGTWAAIFINTNDIHCTTEKLKQLSSIDALSTGAFPTADLYDNMLLEDAKPTYLIFAQTQPEWIMIRHNGLRYLEEWGKELSGHLKTRVIIASAQRNCDFYHFSLYEKGIMLREIEYCYGEDYEPVNLGDKFDFEGDPPGKRIEYRGEVNYIFDLDSIEEYSRQFGLEVEPDYESIEEWMILKTTTKLRTMQRLRAKLKPWWKFW